MRATSTSTATAANRRRDAKRRTRIEWFVACIGEFAAVHGLSPREAFDYLARHRGMEFLVRHYEAEHTLSFADTLDDLSAVCRKHGGGL